MAIEFRKTADEDELVEAFRTISAAFGEEAEERDIESARKTMPVDRVHVAVDDGKFVGVAAAHAFSMTIPGGELPAGGVTWVAVLPTHRRRGVATGLCVTSSTTSATAANRLPSSGRQSRSFTAASATASRRRRTKWTP